MGNYYFHPNYRRCKHHLINALAMALHKAGLSVGTYYPHPLGHGILQVVVANAESNIRVVVVAKPGINDRPSIPASYLELGRNVQAFAITSFDDIPQLVEEIQKIVGGEVVRE